MKQKIYSIVLLSCNFVLLSCGGGGSSDNATTDDFSVSITVANLPSSITYNKTSTPNNVDEYSWRVTFDMNKNGLIDKGDIILSLEHYKQSGSVEKTGKLTDFPADLWIYTANNTAETQIPLNTTIAGNTITLSTKKSQFTQLNNIDNTTQVQFTTATYNSNSQSTDFDYYPNFGTVEAIPANNQFTDNSNDTPSAIGDMQSMSVKF